MRSLVRPAGIEPATYGFEDRHSIQLSYGRIHIVYNVTKKKNLAIQSLTLLVSQDNINICTLINFIAIWRIYAHSTGYNI